MPRSTSPIITVPTSAGYVIALLRHINVQRLCLHSYVISCTLYTFYHLSFLAWLEMLEFKFNLLGVSEALVLTGPRKGIEFWAGAQGDWLSHNAEKRGGIAIQVLPMLCQHLMAERERLLQRGKEKFLLDARSSSRTISPSWNGASALYERAKSHIFAAVTKNRFQRAKKVGFSHAGSLLTWCLRAPCQEQLVYKALQLSVSRNPRSPKAGMPQVMRGWRKSKHLSISGHLE